MPHGRARARDSSHARAFKHKRAGEGVRDTECARACVRTCLFVRVFACARARACARLRVHPCVRPRARA
eukprot:6189697-Pleurochrysis_carterae.AAC.1